MLKSQDIMVFPPLVNRIPIDFREFYPHNQSASLDQSHLGIEGVSTGKVRGIFFSTVLNNCNHELVYAWLCELDRNFPREM